MSTDWQKVPPLAACGGTLMTLELVLHIFAEALFLRPLACLILVIFGMRIPAWRLGFSLSSVISNTYTE